MQHACLAASLVSWTAEVYVRMQHVCLAASRASWAAEVSIHVADCLLDGQARRARRLIKHVVIVRKAVVEHLCEGEGEGEGGGEG